jgi:uncharacterized protein YbaR (Trm112 family)
MNNAGHPISAELLDALRCPATDSRLTIAARSLLTQFNDAVARGSLHNVRGRQIDRPLDAALLNAAKTLAYPVIDRIAVMVSDEAISLPGNTHRRQPANP